MKNTFAIVAGLVAAGILLSLLIFSGPKSAPSPNVGQLMPAVKLEYLRNEVVVAGKPVLFEFWATWCAPCRETIPHLNEIYAKHKARGLAVVGVSSEEKQEIEAFLSKVQMNYSVARDADDLLSTHLKITSIPHAVLVDKAGKIAWEGDPRELSDSQIEQVLK